VLFSGLPFLLGFLPLALGGYALAVRWGSDWAKLWLIGVSLLFYAAGAWIFLPLLVLSVLGNFLLLRRMYASPRAEYWAAAGVALNLAVLGWFKYFTPDPMPPLGLSFFTFSQIGCLLLHSPGDAPPPRAMDYALFAGFFPALLAGPILNPREALPQFAGAGGRRLNAENLSVGAGFFIIGLLKKALLANPMAAMVVNGFADPEHLAMVPAWEVATAYSLQLYFDFSGYSDMAIGLARMFGLHYPDNFDRPYRAGSVIEYWQCWHMSLTRFLMTNVHSPLTMALLRRRRRRGLAINQPAQKTASGFLTMIALPVLVTMLLVSLWHGDTLTFLVFGLLHAAFLIVNHAWRLYQAPPLPKLASVALTYFCVLTAAVFFRAADLTTAVSLLGGMMGLHSTSQTNPDPHVWFNIVWITALYAIVWSAPSTRQIMAASPASLLRWRPSTRWAVAMGCAATLGLLATGGSVEFVYFRF
jgi:D-alanyl-lipoteichoic acid acyltransferase DltB (MBOAT superfamily)